MTRHLRRRLSATASWPPMVWPERISRPSSPRPATEPATDRCALAGVSRSRPRGLEPRERISHVMCLQVMRGAGPRTPKGLVPTLSDHTATLQLCVRRRAYRETRRP